MAEKKLMTTGTKFLIILCILLSGFIVLLILSGFKKVNPYLLFLFFAFIAAAVVYFIRKPKRKDIYDMIDIVKQRQLKKNGIFIDAANAQAIPVTDEITYLYFPNDASTYEIRNSMISGVVDRHLLKVVKEMEKSRLFELWQKTAGAEAKVKSTAESLGVDLTSLGLE